MVSLLNTHHFGSVDKLPSNSVYIGRPGPYGNNHSIKSGTYSREDCVAFHRVDLYFDLINKAGYLQTLKKDMIGKDLACWCYSKDKIVACHGYNYLHVLSDKISDRDYTKTVLDYIVEDLKIVLSGLRKLVRESSDTDWLLLRISEEEVRIDLNEMIRLFKERETDPKLRCMWLAAVVVDLELAIMEHDPNMRSYRIEHAAWNIFRFSFRPENRDGEPLPPRKIRPPNKNKPKS